MVIGLLTIAAIPTVTGVAQGISSKKTQNAQMKEKIKFNMTATLAVDGGEPTEAWIVLRNGRVSSQTFFLTVQARSGPVPFSKSNLLFEATRVYPFLHVDSHLSSFLV